MNTRLCLLLIFCATSCSTFKLRSIRTNMYMTSSFEFCMRYLTPNNVTGCSSRRSGNRGRLLDVSTLSDLTSYQSSQPTIVLIPPRKDILEFAIRSASMVVGILIDGRQTTSPEDGFSEVGVCPDDSTGSSTCSIRKNKQGIDFRAMKIDKPIFLLTNQTAVDELRGLYRLYNQQQLTKGKHIGVHMKSYPYGVTNARVCNRRSKTNYFSEAYFKHYSIKCRSPMINIVWSTLNAISAKSTRPAKSVIVFYTKLDFFSVFQPKNAGAQSTGFGVITLLALAWTLGRTNLSQLLIGDASNKDIVLLFLNGENWNHYGALQLSELIRQGKFPYTTEKASNEDILHSIEAEHIDLIINIDQLGIDDANTHILYDNAHPFLAQLQRLYKADTLQQMTSTLSSLADFHLLNVSTLAIFTDAFEDMNPFYNSHRDTWEHVKTYSSVEKHVYSLLKTICSYFNLSKCVDELSSALKQALTDRIIALFDCFLRSNCTHLVSPTDETGTFYFSEVSNSMTDTFSFLQPSLQQSEVKSYLNTHFLDASSYVHDILLNWIATRTSGTTKAACDEREDVFRTRLYQQSTQTCLRVSINSINLIRNTKESMDDRAIFTSNSDKPELLVYMINDSARDVVMLVCGTLLLLCGLLQTYFLKHLLPVLFNQDEPLQ